MLSKQLERPSPNRTGLYFNRSLKISAVILVMNSQNLNSNISIGSRGGGGGEEAPWEDYFLILFTLIEFS